MIDITKLSSVYDVRPIDEGKACDVLDIFKGNPQFFEYSDEEATEEQVRKDMRLLPTGVGVSDKYYFGFYKGSDLVAVMDIIDGFPYSDIAYIGFFMMNKLYQGRQIGTAIISEAAEYLRSIGKSTLRLVIDKGNPQSTHFWEKNGFVVFREADRDGHAVLEADRAL